MKKSETPITPDSEHRIARRASAGAWAQLVHGVLSPLVGDGGAQLSTPRINEADLDISMIIWPAVVMDITVPSPKAMNPTARKIVGRFVVGASLAGGEGGDVSLLRGVRKRKIVYSTTGRNAEDIAACHAYALTRGRLKFMTVAL